jgi:hypothetical protein
VPAAQFNAPVRERIDPVRAHEYLLFNVANRRARPTVVKRYAQDMRAGRWHFGIGMIVFDSDGTLIDGQHTLMAVIESGVTIEMLVLRGLDPGAKLVIDTGAPRGFAVRTGWRWHRGLMLNRQVTPTHEQMHDWLLRNPSIHDAVQDGSRMYREVHFQRSAASIFLHQTRLIDREFADEFADQIATGANLKAGSATLAFRNWLVNQNVSTATARRPLPDIYLAVAVKAWNAWMTGREVKISTFRRSENFPTLVDGMGRPHKVIDELAELSYP